MREKRIRFFKRVLTYFLLISMWVSAMVFANFEYEEVVCKGISIKLESENERPLLDKKELQNVVTSYGSTYYLDKKIQNISLRSIEKKLEKIPLVKSSQAHVDLDGKIQVLVKEYSPVARLLRSTIGNGNQADQYITQDGHFIRTSEFFTPRVLVVYGPYFSNQKSNLQGPRDQGILSILNFIQNDEFLKAQVAEMEVASDGGIVLMPTIGNTKIDFGLPSNIAMKFEKLKVFYEQIIPNKGWNRYAWVRLKYKNQLICE